MVGLQKAGKILLFFLVVFILLLIGIKFVVNRFDTDYPEKQAEALKIIDTTATAMAEQNWDKAAEYFTQEKMDMIERLSAVWSTFLTQNKIERITYEGFKNYHFIRKGKGRLECQGSIQYRLLPKEEINEIKIKVLFVDTETGLLIDDIGIITE